MRAPQGSEDPCIYYTSKRSNGELLLASFPTLIEHVLGKGVADNACVEIWHAEQESWRTQLVGAPVLVDRAYTILLVRYPGNGHLRGLGRRIAILQRQSFSKWLLERLDEYVDGDADEVGPCTGIAGYR